MSQAAKQTLSPVLTQADGSKGTMKHPRVFLSHASEDKERFVLLLAKGLCERGIDPWVDFWEILPGDSLVDKIFDEGLSRASAVIIVLSQFSIEKPWVKEELNAAFVARVSKGTKIIPVVLDGCEVPAPLRSTVWQTVDDLGNPTSAIESIAAAIHEHRPKPPLGPPPGYAKDANTQIAGLNIVDNAAFKWSCDFLITSEEDLVEPEQLLTAGSGLGIAENELRDSLDVLENRGMITVHHTFGPEFDAFEVTYLGWSTYYETYVPEFNQVSNMVILAIMNDGLRQSDEIATKLEVPHHYVDHVIRSLEYGRHVVVSKTLSPYRYIVDVRGTLKRLLDS